MQFSNEQITKAFEKTQKKDFKIEDIIDIICQFPSEKQPKDEVKVADQYKVFECTACTFLNTTPGPVCTICGSQAPESAKVMPLVTPDAKTEKQIKEEKELQKAQERELRRQLELEQKTQLQRQVLEECKNFFEKCQITNYVAAVNCEGRSVKPILFGCVISGKGWTDFHFKWAKYRRSYIKQVSKTKEQFEKDI